MAKPIVKLVRDLRGFIIDADQAAKKANAQIAAAAVSVLEAYSSGVYKQIVFNTPLGIQRTKSANGRTVILSVKRHGSAMGLGAPYGIGPVGWLGPRGSIPYGNPGWINKQSGKFARSWRVYPSTVLSQPNTQNLTITNVAPYAQYLEKGTSRMIARPINKFAEAYIAQVGPVIFFNELRRAWINRFN